VLIEHIDAEKQCRLLLVELGKEQLRYLAVPGDELRDVQSVRGESITWERDGSLALEVKTNAGVAKRKIVWACHLCPEAGK
jgi:hypothetical protein